MIYSWHFVGRYRLARIRCLGGIHVSPNEIQIWGNNTAEQPLGLLWVAKAVYPDHFADVDLIAETIEFYHRFFGIEVAKEDAARLLAGWESSE